MYGHVNTRSIWSNPSQGLQSETSPLGLNPRNDMLPCHVKGEGGGLNVGLDSSLVERLVPE